VLLSFRRQTTKAINPPCYARWYVRSAALFLYLSCHCRRRRRFSAVDVAVAPRHRPPFASRRVRSTKIFVERSGIRTGRFRIPGSFCAFILAVDFGILRYVTKSQRLETRNSLLTAEAAAWRFLSFRSKKAIVNCQCRSVLLCFLIIIMI